MVRFLTSLFSAFELLISPAANAGIYRWVDDQGNVNFGDRPPADSASKSVQRATKQSQEAVREAQEMARRLQDYERQARERRRSRAAATEPISVERPPVGSPAAFIRRLAANVSAQHTGAGRMPLADAIKRTLALGDDIAIYAMVADAINRQAESCYRRYGFTRLAHGGSRLFLPLRSL